MAPSGGIDRRILVGIFAVLFAGGAAVLAHQWLARQRLSLEAERKKVMANYQTPVEVVVATKDLPEDTLLEASHLRLATIPEKFVNSPSGIDLKRSFAGNSGLLILSVICVSGLGLILI